MVGDVVCVLSCEVLIFFPNCFWDTPCFAVFAANLASHQLNAVLLQTAQRAYCQPKQTRI